MFTIALLEEGEGEERGRGARADEWGPIEAVLFVSFVLSFVSSFLPGHSGGDGPHMV